MANNTKSYIQCGEESCVTGSDLPSMHCPWLLQLLAQRMLSRMSRGGWTTVVPFTLTVVHSSRLNSMLVMHICSKFLKADSAHDVTPVIWNSNTWIPEWSGMQGVKHHIHLQLKVQWEPSFRTKMMIQTKVLKESWSWVRSSVAWKYYHHNPKKKNIKKEEEKTSKRKRERSWLSHHIGSFISITVTTILDVSDHLVWHFLSSIKYFGAVAYHWWTIQ